MTKIARASRLGGTPSFDGTPSRAPRGGPRARKRRRASGQVPIFELTPLEKRVLMSTFQVASYDFAPETSTSGWSGGSVAEATNPDAPAAYYYSSQGAGGPITLSLSSLPAHSGLTVDFSVYAMDKWSGGADSRFSVSVNGLAAPTATLSSGGSLPLDTTQYYVVAPVGGTDAMPSLDISATPTTSGTQSVTLNWGAVSGADGYDIYRGSAAGGETLLSHVSPGSTTSFTDDGSLTPGTLTPPKGLIDTTFGNSWSASPGDGYMFYPQSYTAGGTPEALITAFPHDYNDDGDMLLTSVVGCTPTYGIADSYYTFSIPIASVSSNVTLQFNGPSSDVEFFGIADVSVTTGLGSQPCNCSTTGVSGFTGAQATDAPGPSIGGMGGQEPGIDLTNGDASSTLVGSASGIGGNNTTLDAAPTLVQAGDDTLVIANGSSGMTWFDYNGSNWVERYGGTDQLTQDSPDHQYLFTSGGTQTAFNDFTVSPAALQGKVSSVADAAGNLTSYTYDDSANLTGTVQSTTTGTVTTKTLEQYGYLSGDDPNAGKLASITSMTKTYDTSLDESDASTPYQPIQADYYTYYASDESGGSLGDLQTVSTADAGPAAPALGTESGGTLTAGTAQFYVITAITPLGETNASSEATIIPYSGYQKVSLSWPAFAGATGYKIYRGTSSGSETLLDTLGDVTSYTDTGSISPGADVPPVTYTGTTMYRWYVAGDADTNGYVDGLKYVGGGNRIGGQGGRDLSA